MEDSQPPSNTRCTKYFNLKGKYISTDPEDYTSTKNFKKTMKEIDNFLDSERSFHKGLTKTLQDKHERELV